MPDNAPHRALRRAVSGKIAARERALSVPDRHLLRISRDSLRAPCAMLGVMGGPNHYEAAANIERLTGAIAGIDAPCTCRR